MPTFQSKFRTALHGQGAGGVSWPSSALDAPAHAPVITGPLDMAKFKDVVRFDADGQPELPHDPTGALPDVARERLTALRHQVQDLRSVAHASQDRAIEMSAEIQQHQMRLRYFDANSKQPQMPGAKDDQYKIVVAKLDAAKRKAAAENKRLESINERLDPLGRLLARAEEYVKRHARGSTKLRAVKTAPKVETNENVPAAIERVRNEITTARADLDEVRAAPLPAAVAKAAARAHVNAFAERGRPGINNLFVHGGLINFPRLPLDTVLLGTVDLPTGERLPVIRNSVDTQIDAPALICWMLKDQLLAALDREIDEMADDTGALSDTERSKRECDLLDHILDLERLEVALVNQAGNAFDHRESLDIRALLEISGPAAVES